MKLTDIRIRKTMSEGKMKAVVSITLDDEFAVHDLRIIEGADREFVAMPSRRTPDGSYRDIAHPINGEFRQELESQILQRYHEELAAEMAQDQDLPTAAQLEEPTAVE